MTTTRKDIRFQLPLASSADFNAAKQKAEHELGVAMSANEFAKRVVVQAVRGGGNVTSLEVSGKAPSIEDLERVVQFISDNRSQS